MACSQQLLNPLHLLGSPEPDATLLVASDFADMRRIILAASTAWAMIWSRERGNAMRKLRFPVLLIAVAVMVAPWGFSQTAFTPDQIKFGPAPPFLPVGAQLAVLEGDPMASTGDFTVRLKMPDGYRIAPHWHPSRENVTVLSGTLKVGMGEKFDATHMMSFPAGSFAYLDPDMHHFAMSSGNTVIQIHGMSPLKVNYINPADDPSQSK
jgi:hypothetical protein